MNTYQKLIRNNFSKKYKNSNYHQKNYLKSFFKSRLDLLNLVLLSKYIKKINSKDLTYSELKKDFFKKKINIKKIKAYYRKFEVHLKLKAKYSKKFIALTKKNTFEETYIFLGLLILKLKDIDKYQKLNIILKILDRISLFKNEFKHFNKKFFKQLIIAERNLIVKIKNE